MKTLKNETTEIQLNGQMMTYADLVRNCLDQPPQQGFTFDDLRQRSRIEKALDTESEQIKLEDADATNLKQIVGQMRWGVRHPHILGFADAVEAL